MSTKRAQLVEELIEYFLCQNYVVHGAKNLAGYNLVPPIPNDGFGDLVPRIPDVVGLDREKQRIVFGIVREERKDLDAEGSLTDYNVFLDHNCTCGTHASLLVVMLPAPLITDFTNILTHYVHREYWHRVIVVASRPLKA
jgi:hypothetical protein